MMPFVEPEEFKRVLRCWPSGVTVVTAKAGDTLYGMTVSAFSSVSVSPPLVLVCIHQQAATHSAMGIGELFAVNMLGADQEELSNRFASAPSGERFDGVSWQHGQHGAPVIDGAIAHMECRVQRAHAEGTHTIYIGEVVGSATHPGMPLIYFDGGYRKLTPTS